ncbi:MAG: hypothetical protein KGS72_07330 [Cyanobacteria bacterium REEB67]|nr:hypothetical protein [Cyanobacteria bacterium REEB67]
MSDFAISNPPQLQTVGVCDPTEDAQSDVIVDLKEALNVVVGEDQSLVELSQDELSALEQRRVDLMIWLLNLEKRLSPYTADFA